MGDLDSTKRTLQEIVDLERQRKTIHESWINREMAGNVYLQKRLAIQQRNLEINKAVRAEMQTMEESQRAMLETELTYQANVAEVKTYHEETASFIDQMEKKYGVVTNYSRKLVMDEKDKLELMKREGSELEKQSARQIEIARNLKPWREAAEQVWSATGTAEGTDTASAAEQALGKESTSKLGSGIGKIAFGDFVGGGTDLAIAAVTKGLQVQLGLANERMKSFNLQMGAGTGSSTAKEWSNFRVDMTAAGQQFGITKKEMIGVAEIAKSSVAVNFQEMGAAARHNTGMFKVVRDVSSSFGIDMAEGQKMYNEVYQAHSRYRSSINVSDKAHQELASVTKRGTDVYKDGYMSAEAFRQQSISTLDSSTDYQMSLDEASATIQAISKIKGSMAVASDKAGQQAAGIIQNLQTLSPELVMAMTGGGLEAAYNWPSVDKRTQQSTVEGAFGGLFSGQGKGASDKFIALMANKQLRGLDERTARTAIEMGPITGMSSSEISRTKSDMEQNTKELIHVRGQLDKIAKSIDTFEAHFVNAIFGGKGMPVFFK